MNKCRFCGKEPMFQVLNVENRSYFYAGMFLGCMDNDHHIGVYEMVSVSTGEFPENGGQVFEKTKGEARSNLIKKWNKIQ